jgi:uncharacterized peroxidase-related enzyme
MARVDLLDPTASDAAAVRSFGERLAGPDGSVPAHFAAETHVPSVMRHIYEARIALARGDLGHGLFTKLAVAISMANDCVYCVGTYSKQLSTQLGSDSAVRSFHRAVRDGGLDGESGAVVDFARTLLRAPHALTDAHFERLRGAHGFTDRTFVELIYVVNIVSGYNRLTVALDLEYDHDFPEAWAKAAVGRPAD